MRFFQCFSLSSHGTKIDQKCSQNRFRSSQVESKMAILPLAWLILELMLAHLGALARHLASLVRHLGADMASNSKQNAIFEPTSSKTAPKMPQPPLPSTPKLPKTKENLKFFNVFRFPTHLLKSSKNAPRTAPDAPKLTSKCPSCRYHAPSWHFHDPSWGHHVAILPLLFALLSPTCPKNFRKT